MIAQASAGGTPAYLAQLEAEMGPAALSGWDLVAASRGDLTEGDRVVVPFNLSCGTCFMCRQGLHSQCETS